MALKLSIPFSSGFEVPKTVAETVAYFNSPSECIGKNFPGLESLTKKSDGSYEWNFKELSHSGYKIQIKFATEFKNSSANVIDILPRGDSDTSLTGKISCTEKAGKTHVSFDWNITLSLPIPSLFKSMAHGFAQRELAKLFDRFAANVKQSLT